MTVKLTPIQLDDNTVIYIEATEDIDAPETLTTAPVSDDDEEEAAVSKGVKEVKAEFQKQIHDLQKTIFSYTSYTLAAFKQVAVAKIDKVTLEFGVEMGGETGIPYVTKGTAKSNLKIQVECSFNQEQET
ncbi:MULTISPECIES: CU044_2847 family protein [Planktothricoides]|uniref:CU044_2847 family protein n=2 Tax=Planktothricoides raciborskii TaxID=132608 RepID=A0AAU8JHD4_9CYAN|nr:MULTISPECIES: CU044_2847 family protein [Planktothricoides]KOR36937.1 hypothetical protein AM228_10240 [Planktothricoides sp. SR001]MBD2546253.1 hypothetical protein [Planktothricoides raciborskii FACHB-1370]MBD2584528.1 hypothetical protein [Planktothricoides raciborskii FACHB-1261]